MRYAGGQRIELGDTIFLEGRAKGVVVGIIDEGTYASPFRAEDWSYLGAGVLIDAEDAGLTHYPAPADAWVLIARGGSIPIT